MMDNPIISPVNEVVAALVKFAAKVEPLVKDSVAKTNSYSYSYMSLDAVIEATRPLLAECGLVVVQKPFAAEGAGGVETVIYHTSGQFIECGVLHMPTKDMTAQGMGGAVTYARRYAYLAALNLAPEDDDAAKASGVPTTVTRTTSAPAPAAKKAPSGPMPKLSGEPTWPANLSGFPNGAVKAANKSMDVVRGMSGKTRDSSPAQAGFAVGVIDQTLKDNKCSYPPDGAWDWDGNEVKTHDIALFALFGRTWDVLPEPVSRWIFDTLNKRRGVVDDTGKPVNGPDGKRAYEDNSNYDPEIAKGIAFLTDYVINQLVTTDMNDDEKLGF